MEIVGKDAWEIEDYLQDFDDASGRPVFCSMFDEKKSCHTDSYGTCLNYTEFLHALDVSPFSVEQWMDSCKYWIENDSCGKPLKLIALYLRRENENGLFVNKDGKLFYLNTNKFA